MNYCTSRELSEKWGISQRRIIAMAKSGHIPGAKQYGKSWTFPNDVPKPLDGRTRSGKIQSSEEIFRFPLYVNSPEEDFNPPLSDEERQLRNAQIDFFSCNLDRASLKFENLRRNALNIYVKISALFFGCLLAISQNDRSNFKTYYNQIQIIMAKDFPHKPDMEFFYSWFFGFLTFYPVAAEMFHVDMKHEYDPSTYPFMSAMSLFDMANNDLANLPDASFDIYEIESRQLYHQGHYYEAQYMNLFLFVFYFLRLNEQKMLFHLKKALDIALDHGLIYPVADAFPYYAEIFNKVLENYPTEFAVEIRIQGSYYQNSFAHFMKDQNLTNLWASLSKNDYQYVLFAAQGYTYAQVAQAMHISERSVANKYAEIYSKLGVDSKKDLIELISSKLTLK